MSNSCVGCKYSNFDDGYDDVCAFCKGDSDAALERMDNTELKCENEAVAEINQLLAGHVASQYAGSELSGDEAFDRALDEAFGVQPAEPVWHEAGQYSDEEVPAGEGKFDGAWGKKNYGYQGGTP